MRLAIKYMRGGAANYISHLDMQRAFGRALRRAGVPVLFSQGFNPHIVMSFACPLSVGFATEGDYLEVGVADGTDPKAAMDALNTALPPDIRVVGAFALPEGTKKLMALMDSARWCISFVENGSDCDKIEEAISRISAAARYETEDRRGKTLDIRPLVLEMERRGFRVTARLAASSAASINPEVLARAICGEAGIAPGYEICREDCFLRRDGKIAPLSELENTNS